MFTIRGKVNLVPVLCRLSAFLLVLCGGTMPAAWAASSVGSGQLLPVKSASLAAKTKFQVADKWALIVGISKFHDEKINLKYAAKDAADFAEFLIKEEHFAPDHVLLLTDEKATRKNILESLGSKWLPRLTVPEDLVVLYFSTHGSPSDADVVGVNYLVAHDTEVENLYATGIPMQDLAHMIKGRVHADRVVIFLDACHSGATAPDGKGIVRVGNINAEEMAQGTGQLVISSSAPAERSWESKNAENGVFTRHLIASLRKDGDFTRLGSAFQNLREDVRAEVLRDRGQLQTPVMKSKWEGADLALAIPPAKPRAAFEFVPELVSALPVKPGDISGVSPSAIVSGEAGGEAAASVPTLRAGVLLEHPEFARGVNGVWDSNWGKVTFSHSPIVDDKPVKITGYWMQQEEKHRGTIKSGTFDPKTGVLKFNYWQPWTLMTGVATFKMEPGARRLEGGWKHLGLAGDDWVLWRD